MKLRHLVGVYIPCKGAGRTVSFNVENGHTVCNFFINLENVIALRFDYNRLP